MRNKLTVEGRYAGQVVYTSSDQREAALMGKTKFQTDSVISGGTIQSRQAHLHKWMALYCVARVLRIAQEY